MAKRNQIKTANLSSITKVACKIGDDLANSYNRQKDLKVAQTALKAYGTAINAAKTQIVYKKLTGRPRSNKFFH